MAIKHMASIAERWTREQNDNLTEVDPEAAEARQLLKDHEIFGPFIGAKDSSKDDGITRFEDESWSILYKLLHDVLIKSPVMMTLRTTMMRGVHLLHLWLAPSL